MSTAASKEVEQLEARRQELVDMDEEGLRAKKAELAHTGAKKLFSFWLDLPEMVRHARTDRRSAD